MPEQSKTIASQLEPKPNRYEMDNAAEKIDGYFLPRPHEEGSLLELEALERGREECLKHMRRAIACIEDLSVEDFYSITGREKRLDLIRAASAEQERETNSELSVSDPEPSDSEDAPFGFGLR